MEFRESKTISVQIADRICDDIIQGRYAEGDRIPSVREYAALMEVNVNTIVRCYEVLEARRVIVMKRGVGYFVADGANELILSERRATFMHDDLKEMFRQMHLLGLSIADIAPLFEEYKQQQKS